MMPTSGEGLSVTGSFENWATVDVVTSDLPALHSLARGKEGVKLHFVVDKDFTCLGSDEGTDDSRLF